MAYGDAYLGEGSVIWVEWVSPPVGAYGMWKEGRGVAGKVFAAALPFGTGDVYALVRFGAGQPVGQPGGA